MKTPLQKRWLKIFSSAILLILFSQKIIAQTVVGGIFKNPSGIAVGPTGNIYVTAIDGNGVVMINKNDETISYFGKAGNGNGDFWSSPYDIAIGTGEKLYVTDRGNDRVQVFDKQGNHISTHTGFNFPVGIAIAASGNMVVVNESTHTFKLLNSDFSVITTVGSQGSGNGQFNFPQFVAFDQSGNFYITDTNNHRVQKFDSNGNFVLAFGSNGTGNGQFNSPQKIKVYNSEVFVSDFTSRLQVFGLDGSYKRTENYAQDLINEGIGLGFAFDANGNRLLGSVDRNRLAMYSSNGTFIKSYGDFGNKTDEFKYVSGISYLGNGMIVVADQNKARVQLFDSEGNPYLSFGAYGNGNGQFNGLRDVDVRQSNYRIYTLEVTSKRIQRFAADGGWEATFNISQISNNTRMAIDASGNIWITDPTNRQVHKFNGTTNGASTPSPLLSFGSAGSGAGQFQALMNDITIAPGSNDVYVVDASNSANGRIQIFSSTGSYIQSFGQTHNTTIFMDGVYLFSFESNNSYRIVQYNQSNGTVAQTFSGKGMPIGLNNGLSDMEYSHDQGRLYLADYNNNRIQVLALSAEIDIKQAGNSVAHNSTFEFGGTLVNQSKELTFTISSQGVNSIQLSGTPKVSVSGTNASEFVVNESNLPGTINTSATFSVNFTPTALGLRTATITIANNDSNEGPFTFTINGYGQVAQTISNFSIPTATYGDTPVTLNATASSGLALNYYSSNNSVASVTNNQLTIHGAGTATITAEQAGNSTYLSVQESVLFTVNKATIEAKADNKTRSYRDADPTFTISYIGLKNNDDPSVIDSPVGATTTATIAHSAGEYPITPTGGSDNNYNFTYTSGTLTIEKVVLTVTAENKNMVYGDAEIPSLTLNYSGFKNSENVSFIDSPVQATADATASTHAGTVDIIPSGGNDNNYAFTYVNGTLTIDKAPLTATANNASRTYGDANPTFSIAYSGFRNGDTQSVLDEPVSIGTSATSASNAGPHAITLTGGNDNDYSLTLVNGTLQVNKADLTIKADDLGRVYGELNPTLTITYTGFKNGETSNVIDIAPSASISGSPNATSAAGSTFAIIASGGSDDNYNFSYQPGTLTISKADLTVTAENKAITYGDALPAFTMTYAGFKNGEDKTEITEPAASTNATANSNAGTYAITLAGGLASNYNFQFVEGALTIAKKAQTITFNAVTTKTIGDVSFALSGTATSGLALSFSSASGKVSISGSQVTLTKAGRETITAIQPGNVNYLPSNSIDVSFCINPAKPIISGSFANPTQPVITSSNASGNQWYFNENIVSGATSATYTIAEAGSYKVKTQIDDCVSEFSDAYTVVITGDLDPNSTSLKGYPNPADNVFNIEGVTEFASGKIYSTTGADQSIAGENSFGTLAFNVSQLTPGVYIAKVSDGIQNKTIRFIKK
jgi:DNA-binding beta-propeller fold protein YncE